MKKTIIFALSALLVGACAKEDPEEPRLPEIPPRGFSLDKAPFYPATTTYDAGAFSRSDLQLYLTSKEGKELYIQMDMAHLDKRIDLSQPDKGLSPQTNLGSSRHLLGVSMDKMATPPRQVATCKSKKEVP